MTYKFQQLLVLFKISHRLLKFLNTLETVLSLIKVGIYVHSKNKEELADKLFSFFFF